MQWWDERGSWRCSFATTPAQHALIGDLLLWSVRPFVGHPKGEIEHKGKIEGGLAVMMTATMTWGALTVKISQSLLLTNVD